MEKILDDLKESYESLAKNGPKNPVAIQKSVLLLEKRLLNKRISPQKENEIIRSKNVRDMLPKLQFFYETFETNLEREFSNRIIASRAKRLNDYEDYLLYKRFVKLIKNEGKLAKISPEDRILFIGSGPFPITAILLSKLFNCRVDCYEQYKNFADISTKVVSRLGLSDKIRIYAKKGQNIGKNSYSVVVIALLAKPKDELIEKIWSKALENTRIVCRTSDGLRQIFYEPTSTYLLESYNPIGKVYAKGNQTISSTLLVKSS